MNPISTPGFPFPQIQMLWRLQWVSFFPKLDFQFPCPMKETLCAFYFLLQTCLLLKLKNESSRSASCFSFGENLGRLVLTFLSMTLRRRVATWQCECFTKGSLVFISLNLETTVLFNCTLRFRRCLECTTATLTQAMISSKKWNLIWRYLILIWIWLPFRN